MGEGVEGVRVWLVRGVGGMARDMEGVKEGRKMSRG